MGKRRDKDEHLPNGSIVYWSRRFKNRKGYWRVPVRCGKCGKERTIAINNIGEEDFSGLCPSCAGENKRKLTKTGIEILPTGSIIYWSSKARNKHRKSIVLVRCGGSLCSGYTRYLLVNMVQAEGFTGLCHKCSHYGPKGSNWRGGRCVNREGYIEVWLPSGHPFYCMANAKGYVLEHRLIMAEHLGRPLTSDEIVHHENRDKRDNRIENLELLTRAEDWERKHHHTGYLPVGTAPKKAVERLVVFFKRFLSRR